LPPSCPTCHRPRPPISTPPTVPQATGSIPNVVASRKRTFDDTNSGYLGRHVDDYEASRGGPPPQPGRGGPSPSGSGISPKGGPPGPPVGAPGVPGDTFYGAGVDVGMGGGGPGWGGKGGPPAPPRGQWPAPASSQLPVEGVQLPPTQQGAQQVAPGPRPMQRKGRPQQGGLQPAQREVYGLEGTAGMGLGGPAYINGSQVRNSGRLV